jgi:Fe-Mn family superoxide dismutase
MAHTLPNLPYAKDALAPYISAETIDFHYGKHHQAYVTNLNNLIPGTPFEQASLEEIVRKAEGGIFNNGAQVFNHTFYWHSLRPGGGGAPHGVIGDALKGAFGSFDKFKEEFTKAGATLFGSGWVWLVKKSSGSLDIVQGRNAECPLREGHTPILTCDVWEHAYYIDYRNARPKYLEAFWQLVNWEFASKNLG